MKRKIFTLTIVLSLSLCCRGLAHAVNIQQPAPVTAPLAGANISDLKGKVHVQLPNQAISAAFRGEMLPRGTVITTDDGGLLLRLSDGSEVIVRPHTKVELQDPASDQWHYLELILGRIRAAVKKRLGGESPFAIGTPSAVISVRGTQFDVEVNRLNVTEVDVQDGQVELRGRRGAGASVLISAGMSSRTGIDGEPETPRPTRELRPQVEPPESKKERDNLDHDSGDVTEKLRAEDRELEQEMETETSKERGSKEAQQPEVPEPDASPN
jgi:hypothetical protein